MKKILLFLLVFSQLALFGQYQLPNPGFELWDGDGANDEPTHWNGFPSSKCTLIIGCSSGQKTRHSRSTDIRPGSDGQYSCRIFATIVNLGLVKIPANGTITTGEINIGSTTAANTANHNRTLLSNGPELRQTFTGKPDSIRFWAKFSAPDINQNARMHAVIHTNHDYTDPQNDNSLSDYVVAKAEKNFPQGDQQWHEYTVPFIYNDDVSRIPAYLLLTFTTNKEPGKGSDKDYVWIDDIDFIYTTRLSNLELLADGNTVPFNEFNPNRNEYDFYLCPGMSIPTINSETIRTESAQATLSIEQADETVPVATITVTNQIETRTYIIRFHESTPQLPIVQDGSYCGPGEVMLTAEPNPENAIVRWYDSETATDPFHTGNSFTTGSVSQNTTYWVSSYNEAGGCESSRTEIQAIINPIPGNPTATDQTRCGSGPVTIEATPGENGTIVRWYSSSENTEPLYTGNIFEISVENSTGFFAATYNETTGCESDKIEVRVNVNPLPAEPEVADVLECETGTIEITPDVIENITYRWFNEEEAFIQESSAFTTTEPRVTQYYVSSLNTETQCESGKTAFTTTIGIIHNTEEEITACDEYEWNGEIYTETNDYTQTLTSVFGCDSIVTLHLTINRSSYFTIQDTICKGENYQKHGFDIPAEELNISQLYTIRDTVKDGNILGCDSINSLELFVKESYINDLSVDVCENELPYLYNGEYYAAGVHQVILSASNGCDSTINLTINPIAVPGTPIIQNEPTSCGGATVTLAVRLGTNADATIWYETETGDQIIHTGNQYQTTIEHTTTFYVAGLNTSAQCKSTRIPITATVFPVPAQPVVTSEILCGEGELELEAIPGEFATTCRWYADETTSTILHTGTTYTVTQTTQLYVSSYNAETNCSSPRVAITGSIYPIPEKPSLAVTDFCGEGSYELIPEIGTNGNTINWYNEGMEFITTANTMTTPELAVDDTYTYFISTINTATNCESEKEEITISIHPGSHKDTVVAACVSFFWHNNTYYESGTYRDTIKKEGVCDSTFTLFLTILQPVETTLDTNVCGNVFEFNGEIFTENGIHKITLPEAAQNGCDSIILVNLTLYPNYTVEMDTTVCDSLVWDGRIYKESEEITWNYTIANGCDSTVIINLTVNHSQERDTNIVVCDRYEWNGEIFTENGIITRTFTNTSDCDSTVTVHLTVNESKNTPLTDEICQNSTPGSVYEKNGFTISIETPGVKTETLHLESDNQCDSIVTLTLNVFPTYAPDTIRAIICEIASYNFFDQVLTEPGIYDTTIITVNGCDSLVVLDLKKQDTYVTPLEASVCQDEIIVFGGEELPTDIPGIYTFEETLTAANDCDSVIILTLTVNPVYNEAHNNITIINENICEGNVFSFLGKEFTETTVFDTTLKTIHDCDSAVRLNLVVNPLTRNTLEPMEACDFYQWNDSVYTTSGDKIQIFETENGCDSIVTLPLTIHEKYVSAPIEMIVCDNFTWKGEVITESGQYMDTLKRATDCDSIIVYNFTVNYRAEDQIIEDEICMNEPYNNHGFILPGLTESLDTTVNLQTIHGCDSIVTLRLTVKPILTTTYEDTICQWEDYHQYGFDIPVQNIAGDFNFTRWEENANGCYDTIKLALNVAPAYRHTVDTTICDNQFPFQYGEYAFNEAGIHEIAYPVGGRCDSIVILTIQTKPVFRDTLYMERCDNDLPYIFDENHSYMETGIDEIVYTRANGCDSTIVLFFTVNQTYDRDVTVNICDNELPYDHGDGVQRWNSQLVDIPFTSVSGCDSIIHLNLIVNETYSGTDLRTACSSEFPYIYGDTILENPGIHDIHFIRENGCDSIITLTLNRIESKASEFTHVACDSFKWAGNTYTLSGDYENTFPAANGCDSVVTMHLTINNSVTSDIYETACTSFQWGDDIYHISDTYIKTFPSVNGCDSVVSLHLTINQISRDTIYDAICQGENYMENGFEIPVQEIPGIYHFRDTTLNTVNCDSITLLTLTVNPTVTSSFSVDTCDIYQWNDSTYTSSGEYIQTLQSASGCDSIVTLTLVLRNGSSYVIYDSVCQGNSYSEYEFELPVQTTIGTTTHTRTLENAVGCDSTVILHLTVNRRYNQEIPQVACGSFTWNDSTYTESTRHRVTFDSSLGCDSIVTLVLTINQPSPETTVYDTICAGGSYSGYGFDIPAAETGTPGLLERSKTLVNSVRCDSIVNLKLTVHPTYTIRLNDTVRAGETYNKNGFHIVTTTPDFYRDTLYLTTIEGCDSTCILLLIAQSPIGIKEIDADHSISLYPNPAEDMITIASPSVINRIEFVTINGKVVRTITNIGMPEFRYSIRDFMPGVYFVRIQTDKGLYTKKLIVQ